MERSLRALAALVLALLVSGCGALPRDVPPPADHPGPGTGSVVVQVKEGDSNGRIAEALHEVGVVASKEAFVAEAELEPRALSLQPGFYELKKEMSAKGALALMLDPVARAGNRVVVPEGLTVTQTLELVASRTKVPLPSLQEAAKDPRSLGAQLGDGGSLEGMLAPGAYDVAPGSDGRSVLAQMVQRFNQELLPQLQQTQDPYRTLVVASLAQEEAGNPDEFGRVARVVENRLQADMPLQMDSTVNYTRSDPRLHLSEEDVEVDSPYNTYTRKGLPPTPIASPGKGAVVATVEAPEGDWVYFVAVGPSESFFTSDYEEFLRAKRDAQERGVY